GTVSDTRVWSFRVFASNPGCESRPRERSKASSCRERTARSTSSITSTATRPAGRYQYSSIRSRNELPDSLATGGGATCGLAAGGGVGAAAAGLSAGGGAVAADGAGAGAGVGEAAVGAAFAAGAASPVGAAGA